MTDQKHAARIQLGRNIAAERTRRGWQQLDLAKACRPPLSPSTIAEVELGTTNAKLESIAAALGLSLDELVRT
jgi:transcriptional regulator with XRE-family HTH domain